MFDNYIQLMLKGYYLFISSKYENASFIGNLRAAKKYSWTKVTVEVVSSLLLGKLQLTIIAFNPNSSSADGGLVVYIS